MNTLSSREYFLPLSYRDTVLVRTFVTKKKKYKSYKIFVITYEFVNEPSKLQSIYTRHCVKRRASIVDCMAFFYPLYTYNNTFIGFFFDSDVVDFKYS